MSPETATYNTLSEVADKLDLSHNTLKSWDRIGRLPPPDATFGHHTPGNTIVRAWNLDRFTTLMEADSPAPDTWTVKPVHYLTVGGVAELLDRPVNTVKWWASRRADLAEHAALPTPDGRAGHNVGWLEETIGAWSLKRTIERRPAATERHVHVLIGEQGSVTVFGSQDAAWRELASRYRHRHPDEAMSDEQAAQRGLHAGAVTLVERSIYL